MEFNLQKLVQNKKGQRFEKIFLTITILIVTIIVLFSLFNALVPEAQSAGTQLGDAQTCGDAGGFFNATQGLCLNGTNPADIALVSFSSIPLSGLFSASGIVILLIMVGLLLVILGLVLRRPRK